jgi:hypothetical protein
VTAALALLLAVLPADVPRPSFAVEVVHNLDTLRPVEAAQLAGHRLKFRVSLDSLPDWHGDYTLYASDGPDDVTRTVWFLPGQDPHQGEVVTVEAVLVVLFHRERSGANGTRFEGFREYRLMDAVRVSR